MEALWGCIALIVVLAPLVLLVISLVQIHKLKSAVRNLVSRVSQLEGADHGMPAPRPAPVTTQQTAPASAARPPPAPAPEVKYAAPPPPPPSPAGAPPPPPKDIPPPPPPEQRPPAAPPPPPPVSAKPFDWEAFFGVKLFAWIGGFVLFLGIVGLLAGARTATATLRAA